MVSGGFRSFHVLVTTALTTGLLLALWWAELGNEAAWAKKLWRSWLFEDKIAEQNKYKNMENIRLDRLKEVIYFLRSICKKNHPIWQEIGFSFEKSLQGGFFTSLEIFWMNNKTICWIWLLYNVKNKKLCWSHRLLSFPAFGLGG